MMCILIYSIYFRELRDIDFQNEEVKLTSVITRQGLTCLFFSLKESNTTTAGSNFCGVFNLKINIFFINPNSPNAPS